MNNTSDFAVAIHEQQQRHEQSRIDAARKQDAKLSDDARKVLANERIRTPEPIA